MKNSLQRVTVPIRRLARWRSGEATVMLLAGLISPGFAADGRAQGAGGDQHPRYSEATTHPVSESEWDRGAVLGPRGEVQTRQQVETDEEARARAAQAAKTEEAVAKEVARRRAYQALIRAHQAALQQGKEPVQWSPTEPDSEKSSADGEARRNDVP
ncbi:MAG TPA: hypothetical protein VHN79_12700 [Lacunisphaera sp.]|nr:hypothetical protein [Lacunisphaera sp.]